MTTTHSPIRKRAQAALVTTAVAENDMLRTLLQELQQLREERRTEQRERDFREQVEAHLRERDATMTRLEERLTLYQISPSINTPLQESACDPARVAGAGGDRAPLRLKPDTFDGSAPLREFLSQFTLVARANGWVEPAKTIALASCLRGKARAVLGSVGIDDLETLTFEELKSKLDLCFGESELAQSFYLQFTNRKQAYGEDYALLGADLDRLSRKAYPECTHGIRDKIACSQLVAAISDGYIKRTLQTEGVSSLRIAVERAKALKFINESSFPKRKEADGYLKGNGPKNDPKADRRETRARKLKGRAQDKVRKSAGNAELSDTSARNARRDRRRKTELCRVLWGRLDRSVPGPGLRSWGRRCFPAHRETRSAGCDWEILFLRNSEREGVCF